VPPSSRRPDGAFYGTTWQGGRCLFCGTIFRVGADGPFQVVYAFEDGSNTGTAPFTPLVQARDGNLYGTTWLRSGAVFQLAPDGTLTVLHAFSGDWDGRSPQAALVQATDGALYGTAARDGPSSTGTVFRVTAAGDFEVLYAFPGAEEGTTPSMLLQAADGTVYGLATQGGAFNRGTLFQLTRRWEHNLHPYVHRRRRWREPVGAHPSHRRHVLRVDDQRRRRGRRDTIPTYGRR
jgi:uncharacterized repeat protein (TIGR03803 family)